MKSKKEDQQPLELQLSGRQDRVAPNVRVFVRNQTGIKQNNSEYSEPMTLSLGAAVSVPRDGFQ